MTRILNAANLLPLLMLSSLAALTYWLAEGAHPPQSRADERPRHEPDASAENFVVLRFDAGGNLRYRLEAEEVRHFPDDDSYHVRMPRLLSYRPQSPVVTLNSKSAIVTERGKRVLLQEDVVLARPPFADRPAFTARTPELVVLPDEGRAFNQHPVRITQGENWLTGVGLQMDNNKATFALQGNVRGEYLRKAPTANPSNR
ncbi:MAG: LPS export ABC transporter periplasmic protein LptC [Zoogloeaceae bacterium]|jgi:lipopolysaccharide export system protein LptC|nr:LPS export ABC transporter periplasmic protein LptC [Zoogloeaceae bacterium]